MVETNLFKNTDLSEEEQEKLSRLYHRGDRRDEDELLETTITNYVSIISTAAIVVLAGNIFGPLPLLAFFGATIVLVSLFGGKIISFLKKTRVVTGDSVGAIGDVREAFENACEKQNVDPDKYLLLISDSDSGVAFAFPLSLHPTIVVATNLLENCTPEELTAILSHEIDHHQSGSIANMLFIYLNTSLFAIGGAVMMFTQLPNNHVFLLLSVYGILTTVLGNIVGHRLEKSADAAVTEENRVNFVRGLLKMQDKSYHVEGKIGSIAHLLFDEHPPLNHRIESALGVKLSDDDVDEHIDGSMSTPNFLISILGNSIGTILVALGIIDLIITGTGSGPELIGIGGIIGIGSSFIVESQDKGLKKISLVTIFLLSVLYIIGYFTGGTVQPLETIGWGIVGGIIAIMTLSAIAICITLIWSIFSDKEDLDEVPIMPSDPYDQGDGISVSDINQSNVGDLTEIDDPSEITGDDVVVDEDADEED